VVHRNDIAMTSFSRRSYFWSAAVILVALFIAPYSHSQQDASGKRRLVERSAASYPSLARSMGLLGTVRVEAVVSPDGSVKTVDVKGGHPVLAQAAVVAVRNGSGSRQVMNRENPSK
jgi:TonB family protein